MPPKSNQQERGHSPLGASAAHRWTMCPGSVRMQAGIHDPGSQYAMQGTAAHEICERALRDGKDGVDYLGIDVVVGNHTFTVDEEMASAVQVYLDTIRHDYRPGDILMIEHTFDLSDVVHKGMFGSCDSCIYRPSTGRLAVYDFKYGAGYAVEVEGNKQQLFYAVGGATAERGRRISEIEIVIIQPRAPHRDGPVRRWTVDAMALSDYMDDLKVAAVATEDPDAPLNAGPWCKFCKREGDCPALRETAIAAAQAEFAGTAADLSGEQLTAILEKAGLIRDWISAVFAHALSTLELGGDVPGYKLVPKRATRKWSATEAEIVDAAKKLGEFADEDLYVRKIKSPAQIEGLFSRGQKAEAKKALAAFTIAESSGNTLARDTDPRPAVAGRGAASEFDAVAE